MWGEYQSEEGKIGVIDVTFGYSKQKRFDKKQIKFSLGTTKGVVIDGQVLSGNLDDKTFNVTNLDRAKELKDKFITESDDFFYIADSAVYVIRRNYDLKRLKPLKSALLKKKVVG